MRCLSSLRRLVWSQDVVTFLRRPEDVLKTSVSAGRSRLRRSYIANLVNSCNEFKLYQNVSFFVEINL